MGTHAGWPLYCLSVWPLKSSAADSGRMGALTLTPSDTDPGPEKRTVPLVQMLLLQYIIHDIMIYFISQFSFYPNGTPYFYDHIRLTHKNIINTCGLIITLVIKVLIMCGPIAKYLGS